jgi:predicted aminopeptidase
MRSNKQGMLLRIGVAFIACCATVTLGGCYYIQAARGQMEIVSKRRPITSVVADPKTPEELRARLEYVAAAREFASHELGLPNNASYRSYADLSRPYVVWNVFATKEFSVDPIRWCFPVVGCVVYRGYFKEENARNYAAKLARRGDDVSVAGIPAYSTLGHFKDPILNTMLGWTDAQLAGTVFHELAHQLVYVAGDSEFNEAFATVVEENGLDRWLATRGKSDDIRIWRMQQKRGEQFINLLLSTRDKLADLYKQDIPKETMRERKQYIFGKLKLEYQDLKRSWNGYAGYDHWFAHTLNNAYLVSAATYYGCVPGLERVLKNVNGDFPRFYDEARKLAKLSKEKRHEAVCQALDAE